MNPFSLRPAIRPFLRSLPLPRQNLARAFHTPSFPRQPASWSRQMTAVGLGSAAGLGLFSLLPRNAAGPHLARVECESYPVHSQPQADDLPTESILSPYQLSFGAVCGLCTGVFVKKGAKAIAFFLGGVYVLLQYLSSRSIVQVDWSKLGLKYENLIPSTLSSPSTSSGSSGLVGGVEKTAQKVAPTIGGLYRWITDFLTANFQQRASFLAGFALGIRLG